MIEKEVVEDVLEALLNYDKQPELETGFHDLDEILRGIKKSSIVVIGARPGMGKTTFAMNIMSNLLKNKKKVLFFSLGITKRMFIERLICQDGELNNILLRHPDFLIPEHWDKIRATAESILNYDLTLDDTQTITIEEIKEKIEKVKPDYVFIDYLQLIYTSSKKSRIDAIAKVMNELKQIAKENNCMLLINSQISRAVETRCEKRPLLSDLRECGAIEEVADVVIFIYREEYYGNLDVDDYLKHRAEIIVAKNNFGSANTCLLIFNGLVMKFSNPVKIDVF